MARTIPEWIGKTDDSAIPPRVRLRVLERYNKICHWSKREIRPGDNWDCDHVIALCNGGENRESNLAPILKGKPHKQKTAKDVALKSKAYRKKLKHTGIKKKSRFACSRDSKYKKKIDGTVVPR